MRNEQGGGGGCNNRGKGKKKKGGGGVERGIMELDLKTRDLVVDLLGLVEMAGLVWMMGTA